MPDKLPSKITMGLNLLKAGGKAIAYTAKEGKLPLSPEALAKARLDICLTCPYVKLPNEDTKYHRCTKCGCYLEFKTKTVTESCPKGKW